MADRRWWPRHFAEAAVIVLSILPALALDAAWEERPERVQEAELTTRLAPVLPPSRWAPPRDVVNGMSDAINRVQGRE